MDRSNGQGGAARHFTVVGAGTVGVCCALALQRDGHRVTLIDRAPPARGCSYGNGGLIQTGSVVPIATPGVLRQVPRMLLDPDQPLVIRWQYLPRLMPYLLRFVAAARPARVDAISKALASVLALAGDAYRTLLASAGAQDMIRTSGELYVYESEAAYRSAREAHGIRRARGIRVEEIPPQELRQLEPALAPIFRYAVYLPDSLQTVDPYVMTAALARHFAASGGTILEETVHEIEIGPDGPSAVVTDKARHPVDGLVVALGAYSKDWAARLGSRVPLDTERGYHLMLPNPGVPLRVPVISGDHRFGMVPLMGGIRIAGTAELATLDAPPNYRRAERLLRLAQRILPGLDGAERVPWMGHRPSTPDSLPVIARSPNFRSVYFAFGHGHLGLTMGAATGRLVADLAAGREPPIDMRPFAVDRH
jgi:D-amino-acid dehydrogenase